MGREVVLDVCTVCGSLVRSFCTTDGCRYARRGDNTTRANVRVRLLPHQAASLTIALQKRIDATNNLDISQDVLNLRECIAKGANRMEEIDRYKEPNQYLGTNPLIDMHAIPPTDIRMREI